MSSCKECNAKINRYARRKPFEFCCDACRIVYRKKYQHARYASEKYRNWNRKRQAREREQHASD